MHSVLLDLVPCGASCAHRGQRGVYEPRNEAFWRVWVGSQQVQRQHQNSEKILAQLCGFVMVWLGVELVEGSAIRNCVI